MGNNKSTVRITLIVLSKSFDYKGLLTVDEEGGIILKASRLQFSIFEVL